jgi:hypothetical protein
MLNTDVKRNCLEDWHFRWQGHDIPPLEQFLLLPSTGRRHIVATLVPELNAFCWGKA